VRQPKQPIDGQRDVAIRQDPDWDAFAIRFAHDDDITYVAGSHRPTASTMDVSGVTRTTCLLHTSPAVIVGTPSCKDPAIADTGPKRPVLTASRERPV
jgi:hypothetical protein